MKSNQRDLLCCFLTLDFGGLCAFIRHLSKDNLGLYCSNVTFFFFSNGNVVLWPHKCCGMLYSIWMAKLTFRFQQMLISANRRSPQPVLPCFCGWFSKAFFQTGASQFLHRKFLSGCWLLSCKLDQLHEIQNPLDK